MNRNDHDGNSGHKTLITAIIVYAIIFMILFIIANFTAIGKAFSALFNILTPVAIGCAVAYLCNPILRVFEQQIFKKIRRRVLRRALSLIMTYIVVALIIALFALLLVPELTRSINELMTHFDLYIDNAIGAVNKLINDITTKYSDTGYREYLNPEEIASKITSLITGTGSLFETLVGYLETYGSKLITSLTNILIGLFISIYLLASKEKRYAQASKLFHALLPDKQYKLFYDVAHLADKTFGGFIEGKIIDSLIIGVLTFILLTILKMPYTALISVVVGITNIIPYFGPFIGAIPSAFIILIAEPQKTFLFIVVIFLIQQLDGNVIGPRILGDNTGLSSLGIILAIMIMSGLLGVTGMIIGVPIVAVLMAIVEQYLNFRLTSKGRSTNLGDYYADQKELAVTEQQAHEAPLAHKVGDKLEEWFLSLKKRLKKDKNDETLPAPTPKQPADSAESDPTENTHTD